MQSEKKLGESWEQGYILSKIAILWNYVARTILISLNYRER